MHIVSMVFWLPVNCSWWVDSMFFLILGARGVMKGKKDFGHFTGVKALRIALHYAHNYLSVCV